MLFCRVQPQNTSKEFQCYFPKPINNKIDINLELSTVIETKTEGKLTLIKDNPQIDLIYIKAQAMKSNFIKKQLKLYHKKQRKNEVFILNIIIIGLKVIFKLQLYIYQISLNFIGNMKPFMIYFPRHRHLQYIIQDNYQKESQKLDLTCCPNEWEQVLQFRKWSKLKFLSLVNCGIHPNKMKVVAKYYWANLEQLYLTRNNIGAEGIKMLVKSHTPKLKVLILTKCKIGDEGVHHLTKNCWQNLAVLNLICNCITIDGFMKLQKGSFKKIKSIIMSLNDVNVDWISVMTAFIYDSKEFYLKKHIENDLMMQRFFEIEKQRLHLVPLYAYNQV